MARESTLNVSLTSSLRQYVRAKVESGGYESASEVIRESLRALQERERAESDIWADIRRKVAHAQRQVAEGRVMDGEAAMREFIEDADQVAHRKARTKSRA